MRMLKFTLLLMAGVLFLTPATATVRVNTTGTQAAVKESAQSEKEMKLVLKEARQQERTQKRAERQAAFAQFISNAMPDSDEQLVAILLAFFLGGLGIHRVYLQAKPTIILWYLITFGGFFGLIPLIDFIRIIMGQLNHYKGNNSLFRAFES